MICLERGVGGKRAAERGQQFFYHHPRTGEKLGGIKVGEEAGGGR